MVAAQESGEAQRPTIRELQAQFPDDEWLLIEIDDPSAPLSKSPGEVLAHSPSRAAMFRAARKVRIQGCTGCLTIVAGGTGYEDGEKLREGLKRIAAEEEWISVNFW